MQSGGVLQTFVTTPRNGEPCPYAAGNTAQMFLGTVSPNVLFDQIGVIYDPILALWTLPNGVYLIDFGGQVDSIDSSFFNGEIQLRMNDPMFNNTPVAVRNYGAAIAPDYIVSPTTVNGPIIPMWDTAGDLGNQFMISTELNYGGLQADQTQYLWLRISKIF